MSLRPQQPEPVPDETARVARAAFPTGNLYLQMRDALDVVYADSLSAVSAPGYRFTGDATHPSIVESFRRSITRVSELPCDIMIGAHPFVGDLDGKVKRRAEQPGGPNPFIEPATCLDEADIEEAMFHAILAEQQK